MGKKLTVKIRYREDDADGAFAHALCNCRRALRLGECAAWEIVDMKTGEVVLDSRSKK